ncbi:serine esterase, putative [Plasmodium vivax]|uniref:Serine esterase, putative n=1 Tax=Plasmodium vivax TaxID=5855 RepID=A0A564ZUX7_PLAVI|nr:serine esterase, putative [Plasmodium vivax]
MKEKKTNYRSESIFSANRNLFEVLETLDDEKEAKRSANFFNSNKNILLNLFANPSGHNRVDSILWGKKSHLHHGRNARRKGCKKGEPRKGEKGKEETISGETIKGETLNDGPINDEPINDEPINGEPINEDAKTVRDSPICGSKKWIEHFCWFCSLNLLDEVLEKEIYKEKIHPHVYDLIYDENTYFDTSSMMSVPYEFARFMLTQLDNNVLHDIKINNIIKEEKYLFKKFCRKYKCDKKYRKVRGGPRSGRPPFSRGSSGGRGSNGSSGGRGSNGSSGSSGRISSDSVKSNHSLLYRSRTVSVRYSNYLNIRRELFNSGRVGGKRVGGSSLPARKLFYESGNLGNCTGTDLFYCRRAAPPGEVSSGDGNISGGNRSGNRSNNKSCDTLSLDGEGKGRREAGKRSRLAAGGDAPNRRGGEQVSPSVSNRSGSGYSVGRVPPGERRGKLERSLTSRREMCRQRFAKTDVRNGVHVKGDKQCSRVLRRSNSFSMHHREGGIAANGGMANGGGPPQEARKDRPSSRSQRIYHKYKHNLNYIKQFYYVDETQKKPFPLCLYNIFKAHGTIKQCSRCYCFFNSTSCHCLECKRKSNLSLKNPHYFIFQHGLTASVQDFQNIVNPLLIKYPHLFIYITYSNQSHTFEGVDVGTERICTELNCLFKIINYKINVSMIGHSLGGILNRSVLINLYRKKMFKNKRLINFITFACPHIGVHENMAIMKLLSTYLGAHTIDDLNNKTTLLLKIASVESISILKKFENIIFYGNAQSDWLVGIRTSLILPYTLFNEELILFIIEQAKNVPEIPINIFSVVHLYMRKKKLLFFYFYQDLKNPNYLLNKRKDQNRFLDQMLQTIISSRKLLSCSQRKKFNAFVDYYGGVGAKEGQSKGKPKRKKKSPSGGEAKGGSPSPGDAQEGSAFPGDAHPGDADSSNSPSACPKREDSPPCEEQTSGSAPTQMNRRGSSIHTDGEAPEMRSTRDKPYMSDGVNVQMLPIHFRKNVSTVETNRRARVGVSHSCDKLPPMNVLSSGGKEGICAEEDTCAKEDGNASGKSLTCEDVHLGREEANEKASANEKEKANVSAKEQANRASYYDRYLCIPESYKIASSSLAVERGGGPHSGANESGNREGSHREGSHREGNRPASNRHSSNSRKKKLGDYKHFEKLFFECLKRKIINDIKTLDNNLKRKKKKADVAPSKSFSLQNTINALKNYSLFYLKNGAERGAHEGGGLDGGGLQSGRHDYQPIADGTLGEALEATHSVERESCEGNTNKQSNETHTDESNRKKESSTLQLCDANSEEYDYISEFFYTTSEDNEGGDANDESLGDEPVLARGRKSNPGGEHPDEQQSEHLDDQPPHNPGKSAPKKRWKGTTLLKGITKNDKKKYKQILSHIYTISNEELIEKFCKNPELLYYEVLFYCLNQLPIQRYTISLPLYSNAHVQIIAHPRICSGESATVKHFVEHLIL